MFNFTGASFCYPVENNNFGSHDHPFDAANSGSSAGATQTIGFDSDATIAGPSTAATGCWWLGPSPNGDSSQYPRSTVLGAPWNGFTDPNNFQTGLTRGNRAARMNNVDGLDALGQQYLNIPECQELSMAGPSTVTQPSLPPAGFTGPTFTHSPIPALPWGSPTLHNTSSIAAGSHRSGMDNQPLATPGSGGQWPYPVSAGKCKARATDRSSPRHPSATGGTMAWQYHKPPMPQHDGAGSNPFMVCDSVRFVDIRPTYRDPTGQRCSKHRPSHHGRIFVWASTVQERGDSEGKGDRKGYRETETRLQEDPSTRHQLEPNLRSALLGDDPDLFITTFRGVTNAKISDFIKEDLHQSPLVVKELGVKSSREQEQYLTGILNVLYPAREGEKRDVQRLLDQVADEVKSGLFMVNDTVALRGGPSIKANPENLDDSAEGVRHRRVEKERRDASHETLGRMSFFFKALPRSLSRNEVLFFAITYLVFGVEASGDGFVIALPKL